MCQILHYDSITSIDRGTPWTALREIDPHPTVPSTVTPRHFVTSPSIRCLTSPTSDPLPSTSSPTLTNPSIPLFFAFSHPLSF